jgi:hypothetical protein
MKKSLAEVLLPTKEREEEHVIDCDADPFVPKGWKIEEHQKGGQFKWNSARMELSLDEGQQNGNVIRGHELRKKLVGKPVLNANVLDYLLAHPHLIPEEWEGKTVLFWGTIYSDAFGDIFVRCLCWIDDVLQSWYVRWLDDTQDDDSFAVLRAD